MPLFLSLTETQLSAPILPRRREHPNLREMMIFGGKAIEAEAEAEAEGRPL